LIPASRRRASLNAYLPWAGLCPRQDASAGKQRSTRLRKGAPWLKPVLVQCTWAAVRGREDYLRAQFLRLKHRRGPMKAIVAVAASMLTAATTCCATAPPIATLGPSTSAAATRLVAGPTRRLHHLGYAVTLHPAA
jgi:hypothetical protein